MENLKEFSLFNPGLRSSLSSSQKNKMALNIINTKIFNYKSAPPQTAFQPTKRSTENIFFMNENFQTPPLRNLNSLSQSILNINKILVKEKSILPIIQKFRPKRKNVERRNFEHFSISTPSTISRSINTCSRLENNDPFALSRSDLRIKTADVSNIRNFEKMDGFAINFENPNNDADTNKNFNEWVNRSVYTPYKISVRFRKDFEPKVEGKYDLPLSMTGYGVKKRINT
jgi:hypothetical protein